MTNAPVYSRLAIPHRLLVSAAAIAVLAVPAFAQETTAPPAIALPGVNAPSPAVGSAVGNSAPAPVASPAIEAAPTPRTQPYSSESPAAASTSRSPSTANTAAAAKRSRVRTQAPATDRAATAAPAAAPLPPSVPDGTGAGAALAPPINATLQPALAPAPRADSTPAVADDSLTETGALAALIAALGFGGAGLVFAGRRRRSRPDRSGERTAGPVPAIPTPDPKVAEHVPAMRSARPDASRDRTPFPAQSFAAAVKPGPSVQPAAPSPERFAMPAGPVPTGAEREALIERMVAAPPDASNPFKSRRYRRRRARINLRHRERLLREAAAQPFDWRTYEQSEPGVPVPPQPVKA